MPDDNSTKKMLRPFDWFGSTITGLLSAICFFVIDERINSTPLWLSLLYVGAVFTLTTGMCLLLHRRLFKSRKS